MSQTKTKPKHHGKHRTIKVPPRPLTPLQERFVEEYLIDLNATDAAIRAGYSPRSAYANGPRLLTNPEVIAAIGRAKAARNTRCRWDQDRVLYELEALAFSNVQHYTVDRRGNVTLTPGAPPEAWRAIKAIKRRILVDGTIKVELELWDKVATLKTAGRHVGLFPDRVEFTGKDGAPLYIQKLTDEELQKLKAMYEDAQRRQ